MKVGDRIRLRYMPNDPDPIPEGATGTVNYVSYPMPSGRGGQFQQVGVDWDAPHERRTLLLCIPPDRVEILTPTGCSEGQRST